MKNYRILLLALVGLLLVACQNSPRLNVLEPSLWKNSNYKIAVFMAGLPTAEFYISDRYGIHQSSLANLAVGKKFLNVVKKLSADHFLSIQEQVVTLLHKEGVNTVTYRSNAPVTLELKRTDAEPLNSREPYSDNEKLGQVDVSRIVSESGADKALVLQLRRFGAVDAGGIPIFPGPSHGYSQVQVFLVNTSNEIEWQLHRYGVNVLAPIEGKWKQEPDYPNLKQAVNNSLSTARQHIINVLFPM